MVLEGWESENRQREQQAEPGSDHIDPMADPPGDVFAVLARELRPTRAMGQKLREEDDREGHDCSGVEIVWRHLRCLAVGRLHQVGQIWTQTIARGPLVVLMADRCSLGIVAHRADRWLVALRRLSGSWGRGGPTFSRVADRG